MGQFVRSIDLKRIPAPSRRPVAKFARTGTRSTLYNTDGQIFSDAGVPVVLFMENYDINRSGYHDTHDTVENIDLDYGRGGCSHFHRAPVRPPRTNP